MPIAVRVYIVCHKTSYPHLADAADDRLRWYVVNDAIPDKTIAAPPASVVREWDLPVYEPALQAQGCREASAFFHALANPALRDAEYIGFAQYDMRIPSAALDAFEAAARDGDAFVDMMTRVNDVAPDIHAALGFDTTHLAGTLERVFGVWIAAAIGGGRLEPEQLQGLEHDQSLRV